MGNFLTSWGPVSFLERTLLHGVNYYLYNDTSTWTTQSNTSNSINPSNIKLNPMCHLLALLGAHHILHISRIRVKKCKKWDNNYLFQIKQNKEGQLSSSITSINFSNSPFLDSVPLSRFYKHKNVNKCQMNSVRRNSEEGQYAAINHKTLNQDCTHLLQLNHQSQEDCSDPEDGVAASSFMMSADGLS